MSMGAPFWLAVALALLAMVALAFFTERMVCCGPLVKSRRYALHGDHRPGLLHRGHTRSLPGRPMSTALDLGIADEPIEWLMRNTGNEHQQIRPRRLGIAAALVAVLAVFFNKTRTGARCARSPTIIRRPLPSASRFGGSG